MLPHILHSTTRSAAAVVHNQTQTLRNVLQLQTSNPSSGSNSNWGNGPSSGGPKFNTGSRFHTNYNVCNRSTQFLSSFFFVRGSYSHSFFNIVFGTFSNHMRFLERRTCSDAGKCCYLARCLGFSVRRDRRFCSSKNNQAHTSEETTHTQFECFTHCGRPC